jgi:hypothetical protein
MWSCASRAIWGRARAYNAVRDDKNQTSPLSDFASILLRLKQTRP